MIENEEIWIKIIFKKYLETHKSSWKHFKFPNILCSIKHQITVFEIVLKNYFLKIVFDNVPKQAISFHKIVTFWIFLRNQFKNYYYYFFENNLQLIYLNWLP